MVQVHFSSLFIGFSLAEDTACAPQRAAAFGLFPSRGSSFFPWPRDSVAFEADPVGKIEAFLSGLGGPGMFLFNGSTSGDDDGLHSLYCIWQKTVLQY